MEIAPGVHSLPVVTHTFMGMYAPNVYLVVGGEAAALIDSGYGRKKAVEARIKYIADLSPVNLAYIVVTHHHVDHLGGAREISEATGARVLMHSLSAAQAKKMRLVADRFLEDGDTIDLGGVHLEVIHVPGHTAGNICVYMREEEVLFAGDHILGIGTTVIKIPQGDMAQYIDSLSKLLSRRTRLICPGHGPLVREPGRRIKELIAQRREREQQLLSCLARGRWGVVELVAEIYPELDRRLLKLAGWQVESHLAKLVREGRADVSGEKYGLK